MRDVQSKLKAYLAGPIENEKDFGRGWREEISPRLLALGIVPLDPTKSPSFGGEKEWMKIEQRMMRAKREKDWKTFSHEMHEIWVSNKEGVDAADFLIVHCKDTDMLSGTIREMHEAYNYHLPIFLVVDGDPRKLKSHTLYMTLSRGKIFESFDAFFDYLEKEILPQNSIVTTHCEWYQVSQKLFIVNDLHELFCAKAADNSFYDMPGGRLNREEQDEESMFSSLLREISEELGDEVVLVISPLPCQIDRERMWDKKLERFSYRKVLLLFYKAHYRGGTIKLSDGHTNFEWVDIKTFDPSGKFKPGHERAIKRFLKTYV